MRRISIVCALVVAVLAWSVAPVAAQARLVGPGGLLYYSNASSSAENSSVSQQKLFSFLIPPGVLATMPAINTSTTWPTTAPVSVKLIGQLTALAGVQASLGINYGSGATLSLLNSVAITPSGYSDAPFVLTVYLVPMAMTSATPNTRNSLWMQASLATGGQANGGAPTYSARVIGTSVLASPTELNIYWQWLGSAVPGGTSSIRVHSRQVKIGL